MHRFLTRSFERTALVWYTYTRSSQDVRRHRRDVVVLPEGSSVRIAAEEIGSLLPENARRLLPPARFSDLWGGITRVPFFRLRIRFTPAPGWHRHRHRLRITFVVVSERTSRIPGPIRRCPRSPHPRSYVVVIAIHCKNISPFCATDSELQSRDFGGGMTAGLSFEKSSQ